MLQQIGPLSSHTDIFQMVHKTISCVLNFWIFWWISKTLHYKRVIIYGSIALNGASGQLLQSALMSAAFLEGQYLKPCILLLCRAADKDMEYFII